MTFRSLRPIHPVPMRTTFRNCFLVNFAVEPSALARQLPAHLTPDLHEGKAFLSIVIAEMERMRPAFLPRACGVTYSQVVYRAVVRWGGERGVAFLRSDADNRAMVFCGNALTFFRFNHARIAWQPSAASLGFQLDCPREPRAAIRANYQLGGGAGLPASSRFRGLAEAQAFLSELFVAFGAQRGAGRVERVRIQRTTWSSDVVRDTTAEYRAMDSGLLFAAGEASLDSIFFVRQLQYHWHRLTVEPALRIAPPPLPPLLTALIEQGAWPRAIGGQDWDARVVPAEVVRRLVPDEDRICLYGPPFRSVAELCWEGETSFWRSSLAAPDEIDHQRAIPIGDFGMGSDAPLILDYRAGSPPPRVLRLRYSDYADDNHWVEVAPSFAEFVARLGLVNDRPTG